MPGEYRYLRQAEDSNMHLQEAKAMKRSGWRIGMLCLFLMGGARGAWAQEGALKTLSPYFQVEGKDSTREDFPLRSTRVRAQVSGVIADVLVTQIYANEGSEPINARYIFPGSTRSSVHGMKITLGEHVVVAKIKERVEARKEFEQAKSAGKSASLLEQHRPNVFSMSVANILPGDKVEVELHYSELLVPTDGVYEFIYPTVVGPRYSNRPDPDLVEAPESVEAAAPAEASETWVKSPYLHLDQAPGASFSIEVRLSTGIPLRDVTCPSHAVIVDWQSQSVARVSLAKSDDIAGNRDFVLDYRLAGEEIQSGLLLFHGETENFFLLMVQPPERVKLADIPAREYVFVLDVSGSMSGFPLETAKELIRDLIGHLRETDRFDVVLFAGDSRVMAPAPQPATAANIARAIAFIERQGAGGGTELAPALETALRLPRGEEVSRTVVVITDGYVEAEQETFALIQKNLSRTNFFSFGIGTSVNRYLVEGMAKAGLGEPFVVTRPEEAASTAARFRSYIESPVLTGVSVSLKGFDAYDLEPPALPDLFAQRPVVLFGKYRGNPTGEIILDGTSGGMSYERRFTVAQTRPLDENAALRYLWARTRIARLSDFSFGRPTDAEVSQVKALGLNYSLLTRYTSFIAVIEPVRNLTGAARDVSQPLPLPQGVSESAVGGYAAGPEPEMLATGAILALLMALIALRRRSILRAGH